VNEVKNSIFQRIADVVRTGGPDSYTEAILGRNRGVDKNGSSIHAFIGKQVIVELLTMSRVGIFVDRQRFEATTKATKLDHPYLYVYKAEDILSWNYSDEGDLEAVLLKEVTETFDQETGLPSGTIERLRFLKKTDSGISVKIFENNTLVDELTLNLKKMPFILLSISQSLLVDVADYQAALLNIESSDLNYILKANYPFYTEQVDGKATGTHLKKENAEEDSEITTGAHHGRTYGKDLDRPDFIAPPTGPIEASMKKQEQIKADIRLLINLSITNLQPKMASEGSKKQDDRTLEAGLSYIGMELEGAERQIASIWSEYEGSDEVATINYPKQYTIKSDEERLKEAKELEERLRAIPSETYKREVAKMIANVMLGTKVTFDVMETIHKEIDSTKILTTDPDIIFPSLENNVITFKDAAEALGLPNDPATLEQAAKDHMERAMRIAKAQASQDPANRGNPAGSANGKAGSDEKRDSRDSTLDPETKPKVRGDGK
jgi:hypothetical protein